MNKLLIVVDYQNDFVDGSLGFTDASNLHEKICEKIENYVHENMTVVFTADTHPTEYLQTQEGRILPVEHCIEGTTGWELYGRLSELAVLHRVFRKNTFGSADLFDYLRDNPFDQIELVGLVSNICVLCNAVLAKTACPEARIVVNASYTASFDQTMQEKALDVLSGIQVQVIR